MPPHDERTRSIQQLWSAGDYASVGERFAPAAQHVVDALDLAGQRVLDAGTGTGNAALAAAHAGADVSAFDLTPQLLRQAADRARTSGLDIEFREGDLLDVPFPSASFDVVLSVFAAFLTDDPGRCLAELVRVCRPGGRVVTTAWSEDSIFVRMVRLAHAHDAELMPRPDGGPFADFDPLRVLARGLPVDRIELREEPLPLAFPSAKAAMEYFEATSGPVQHLASAFGDRWSTLRAAIVEDWTHGAVMDSAGVLLPAEYCVATIHRTGTAERTSR